MPNPWRYLVTPPWTGERNMAYDVFLAESLKPGDAPIVRCYEWHPPAVSIGRLQVMEEAADLAGCRAAGVDVVRRPTGGRALLHHLELTYSIAFRADDPLFPSSVAGSYEVIERGLRAALLLQGVTPDPPSVRAPMGTHPREAPGELESCFVSTARHDLRVGGKKLIGSAQARGPQSVLQHGSLWLDRDLPLLSRVFPRGEREAQLIARSTTTLREILGRAVPFAEAAAALRIGFETAFDIHFDAEPARA